MWVGLEFLHCRPWSPPPLGVTMPLESLELSHQGAALQRVDCVMLTTTKCEQTPALCVKSAGLFMAICSIGPRRDHVTLYGPQFELR